MKSYFREILRLPALFVFSSFWVCCGTSRPGVSRDTDARTQREFTDSRDKKSEDPQIEGLLGTVSEEEVELVISDNMNEFMSCYSTVVDELEEIGGFLRLVLFVGSDGRVEKVHLSDGNLGSLRAESCISEKAGKMRFPKPSGGSRAEISYTLTFSEPYGRPVTEGWDLSLSEVIEEHRADVEACLNGRSGVRLTVYIIKNGAVASAGATASSTELTESAKCLAETAFRWTFVKDPGDNVAKASAEL